MFVAVCTAACVPGQMQWPRLLEVLQSVRDAAVGTCDRVALRVVGDVAPVITSLFKSTSELGWWDVTAEVLREQVGHHGRGAGEWVGCPGWGAAGELHKNRNRMFVSI